MNTKCPQCGNPYNVTAAHVGRKFKCKTCASALVVTAAGVELQNAPAVAAAPPPPPPVAAASAFSFDDGGEVVAESAPPAKSFAFDADADAAPARPGPMKAVKKRAAVEDADDDRPARAAVKPRAPRQPGAFGDYLRFRKMVVPVVIQAIFWLGSALIVVLGLVAAGFGVYTGNTQFMLGGVAFLFVGVPLYIFLLRMYCEILIVIFRINDTLLDIKQVLERTDR